MSKVSNLIIYISHKKKLNICIDNIALSENKHFLYPQPFVDNTAKLQSAVSRGLLTLPRVLVFVCFVTIHFNSTIIQFNTINVARSIYIYIIMTTSALLVCHHGIGLQYSKQRL